MDIALDRSAVIDAVLEAYLADHPDIEDRWLLEQTMLTAGSWRGLLRLLAVEPGWSVLDLGTGFGAMALELAAQAELEVTGVDADPSKVAVAQSLADLLAQEEVFLSKPPSFEVGDAYELGFEDASFDLVVARLVYQYLADPQSASDEIWRVTRPGGFVCVQEVDDQFSITYPEVSDAFARLHEAFVEASRRRGEDRYAGRKLSTWLESSGFEMVAPLVWPQAAHGPSSSDDLARRFDVERLRQARAEIVAGGIMEESSFDEALEMYATEDVASQFRCLAQVVVIARRPA